MAGPRFVGAHLPLGKGFGPAVRQAHALGMTALQVFTSSPRMWKGGPADPAKAEALASAVAETGFGALVSHDTYLVNLCHPDPEVADKSYACLKEEIERCAAYGIPFVVSHMGSTLGQETAVAQSALAEATLRLLAETPESVTLLMETTAGQGSALHANFEELATTFELTGAPDRLAVCLDTCHIFAAGYDIRDAESYEQSFAKFDSLIGVDKIKVLHVNDSKMALGSRVDRHENIGKGLIGVEAFRLLVNDSRFFEVPMILETPAENDGHAIDHAFLLSLVTDAV